MPDPLKLSVSKTKCFNQCRKQFHYSYILKLPKKQRDYHVFGSFLHAILENFHNQYIQGCLLPHHLAMKDAFQQALREYKDQLTPEMRKEAWGLIDQYLRLLASNPAYSPRNVLAVEKRFEVLLNNTVLLNGAIDKISWDADQIIRVSDYKTSKSKKYLANDFAQLLTYAYVMLQEMPELTKVRASYIMLRHNFEEISTEFSRDEILAVKDKYLDYAAQISDEKDYAASPTILCGWCDHLSLCEEGQKQTRIYNGEVEW